MKFKSLLISSLIIAHSNFLSAAVIDIDALMKTNVQPWLNAQIKACDSKYPLPSCAPVTSSTCLSRITLAMSKRTSCYAPFKATNPITNLTIRNGSVRYAQVTNSPIPSSIKTRTFIYENCASTPLNFTTNEKVTVVNGLTLTTKDSIKTNTGVTAGFKVGGADIGLSASHEVSFEKQQTTTQDITREYTLNIQKTLPPYTTLLVSQDIRELYSWFDFEGDLFLDGLVAQKEQYVNIIPNNFVTVKGEIFNTTSEVTSAKYQEIPCNTQQSITLQKTQSGQNTITSATQTGLPIAFTNGMLISTANKVGNVQVRVKSSGSDYCKVNFHSSAGTYSTLARPTQMSEWENLITYTSSLTTSLSGSSNCESGFSAEIRY
jgi:hypothetical protein